MRAITLWQPWAHLVSHGHKLIENRTWEYPEALRGKDIAIHAGKKWDADRLGLVENIHGSCPTKEECVFGAIVAVARLGIIVKAADDIESIAPGQDKWFFGKYGWVLENVRLLPNPIETRGFQKLWDLSTELEAKVLEQLPDGVQ